MPCHTRHQPHVAGNQATPDGDGGVAAARSEGTALTPRHRPSRHPTRGSAPRRLVKRPFFHGLRRQQHPPLRTLGLATPAVAVNAQQASSVRARALVQHGERCSIKRGVACRGSSPRGAERRVGQSSEKKSAGGGFRERARVDGRSYVHDEGSGATLQARGQVTGTRGSHNDPALASWSLNCTF